MLPDRGGNNPMDQIRDLQKRLADAVRPLGVDMQQVFVSAGMNPGDPNVLQAVFVIDRDKAFKSPEELAMDEQFRQIALETRMEEDQEKARNAREALKATLASGILGDDDGGAQAPEASEADLPDAGAGTADTDTVVGEPTPPADPMELFRRLQGGSAAES